MRKTIERKIFIEDHPKYKNWRSHYDEGHLLVLANLAITKNNDGERWGSEIEANCKEKP
jgi:hypothetical protein